MKTFEYTARSASGTAVAGVAEANTQAEAVQQLREGGLIVESIAESGSEHDIDLRLGGRKTKEKELAIVCQQFSILLTAGLPIVKTLELIADQTEDKTLHEILSDTADDVAAGYALADSLAKHGEGLPVTFIESIRAGESAGTLGLVFERLGRYYEKSSRTKGKLKSAMVYPSFVIVIAVVVVAVIMVAAVPMFRSSFESMGEELPLPTQIVIGMSDFFTNFWWLLILLAGLAYFGVKLGKRNEKFRLWWARLGVKVPVLGRINLMTAASQFSSTMSVMTQAGLPITRAVEVTGRSLSNYYMSQSLATAVPDLEAGRTLASCLAKEATFPELVVELTAVGEQTGSLAHTLDVLSDYYDNEVETASSRAMSVLEPAIIVVLAVVVCLLLLAVYLPMFTIYGGVGA